jgi:hypothetical protein
MAARRTKTTGVRQPDGEGNEHLAAPHEGVTADDLTEETERVLAELGENVGAVVLYRMKDNKPGEYDFVARVAATEFTPEYVKEQYGGGDYKVVIIDTTQGPLNPVFFSIDRRFVGKVWGSASPAAVVAQGTGDPFRDKMLEILLAKALTPAPAPANTTKDTIELVLAVVAAMKGNGDSGAVMEQVSAMISTATTLAQAMNPPEGLAGVAGQFLPVIERLVPPRATARASHQIVRTVPSSPVVSSSPNAPAAVTVNPTPTPTPPPTAPGVVAGSIVPKWLVPFRSIVAHVVKLADRGSDPVVYAEMAIDELEDDEVTFNAAVEAMNEGRLLSDFFAVAPDMQLTDDRKAFAVALVERITEGLRELLANQSEDEPTNEGSAAHG